MRRLFAAVSLAAAILVSTATAPAAQEPEVPTVNIVHKDAEGRLLVNGIPAGQFGRDSKAGQTSTMALNPGLWMRNGANTITVESRAKKPGGEARIVVVRSMSEKPEFERTIAGTGTVTHQTNGSGLPQWSFYGSQPWTGDTKAVLDAVKSLHAAFGKKDIKTIEATRKAFEDDLTQVMGPMPDDARAEFREIVKTGKLATLPADLRVTAHLDNRLFVVARANGEAPIQLGHPSGDPMMTFDTGQYWVRHGGTWQVVR